MLFLEWFHRGFLNAGLIGCAIAIVTAFGGPTVSHSGEVEREVSSGALKGAFLEASKDAPIALIIPGSGPTDRDGNSPAGLNTDAYKLLAEGLLEQGISTVRVDKRGLFSSREAGDPNNVTVESYVLDYGKWVETLTNETKQECVFLLGHSEGGVMATAAAIGRTDVCGLILLAMPGRPLGVILEEQLRSNPANAPVIDEALSAISALEAGNKVETSSLHPALQSLFHEKVQGFLISMMSHDPAQLMAKIDVPSIIIQGGTDLQVSEIDAKRLAASKDTKLVFIPAMNHILKDASNNRNENLKTYGDPSLPLSDGLVEAITTFVFE